MAALATGDATVVDGERRAAPAVVLAGPDGTLSLLDRLVAAARLDVDAPAAWCGRPAFAPSARTAAACAADVGIRLGVPPDSRVG